MRDLVEGLNKPNHLIVSADIAAELDAKRAIDQGTRLARWDLNLELLTDWNYWKQKNWLTNMNQALFIN